MYDIEAGDSATGSVEYSDAFMSSCEEDCE
jgi:hypothetical protein